jgi:hypothetical protein
MARTMKDNVADAGHAVAHAAKNVGLIVNTLPKHLGIAALAVGVALGCGSPAFAQFKGQRFHNPSPGPSVQYPFNPNPYIAPGVRLQQFAYNTAVLGKVYSQVPPYLLGYSPYPGGGYGQPYNPAAFSPSPYTGYAQPSNPQSYGGGYSGGGYGGNPYAGGYSSGGGIDPLTGMPISGGGYSPGQGNSSYSNPYQGGYMYGSSADIQAYAQYGLSAEKARILREQANQAKFETRKKLVDTLAYIRANEYTFTQEQADIAKRLLQRIQNTPTATEIQTGKSLNILMQDLSKFDSKQLRAQTVTVDEEILKLLNVSGSYGNLGLLRNDGQVPWPLVFEDTNVLAKKDREDIDNYAKQLFFQVANANGKLDGNTLKDLDSALRNLRDDLQKKIKIVNTQNYLEGKRFLDDFDAAVVALRKGDAVLYLDYAQKFAKGGRTVQELVEYMTKNGLKFAPAMPGDERAYHAVQTALAAQSLALHSQVAANKEY